MLFQKDNKEYKNGFSGKHHTEESKEKNRQSHLGMKLSEEHKQKLSEARKGKKTSDETRKKLSEAHKGKFAGAKHPNWKGGITKDKKHTNELAKRWKSKRRALKKGAEGSFILAEWELLKKQYGHRCPVCNRKEPKVKLTIDHIIPLSKGGSNYIENIQPLCKPCNSRKRQKAFKISKKGQFEFIFNKCAPSPREGGWLCS